MTFCQMINSVKLITKLSEEYYDMKSSNKTAFQYNIINYFVLLILQQLIV